MNHIRNPRDWTEGKSCKLLYRYVFTIENVLK